MTPIAGIFALLFSAAFAQPPIQPEATTCSADHVTFVEADKLIKITVEIADDPQERAQGLMFRQSLPQGSGMLFIYETPAPVSFWMQNTLIPLDMIFLDQRGIVRHIHPNARPHDTTSIPGNLPGDTNPERLMVLEVPGGDVARLGLRIGMAMAHPALPQNIAAAPCK